MPVELQTSSTPGLTTLQRLRVELGYDADETADDTRLAVYVASASNEFLAAVAQPILTATEVYELPMYARGTGHVLPFHPVSDCTLLERYDGDGEWTEIDDDEYRITNTTGSLYRLDYDGGFRRGGRYRATLTVGHAVTPSEVDRVVCERAALRFLDSVATTGGKRLGTASIATTASGDAGALGGTTTFSRAQHDRDWRTVVTTHQRHI